MKDTIWIKKGRFTPLAVVLMFALPLVTALICLCFGRMNVPVGEVLTALRTALTGESTSNVQNYSIVINLRLPRILTAIIVGAGLSCAGNTYQSLFSNPLATPDILGVTSGTCVGAILAIILSCSILETQLIALVFGLISVCFTLKIAGKSDGRSMVYLVLAGTIASSLFNALGSLLKYTADPQDKLPEITYWLMGSLSGTRMKTVTFAAACMAVGLLPLPPGVFAAMRHIIYCDFEKLFQFKLGEENLPVLAHAVEQYLLCQVERILPALNFYKTICI